MLHAQCTSALSSGFPISQGNAEALERRGGKTKHSLIFYFLSNRIVCVKIIGRQKWDVFETRCILLKFTIFDELSNFAVLITCVCLSG